MRDGVAQPSLGRPAMQRVLAPLSSRERLYAMHLARTLAPTRPPAPGFSAAIPSHTRGLYSGAQYTFTSCPLEHATPGSGRFTLDNMLDDAFRSGTKTVFSLTNQGDDRHSNYYKESQTTPSGKYTIKSYGTPEFTSAANEHGRPVTGSIFYNTVRNNQTGQMQHMKMVHMNGWPDQTSIESKNQLKILSDVGNNLDAGDLRKVLIHCSQGRNRTGSVAAHLEMMNAAATGRKPNVAATLDWMRAARVADSVNMPLQLCALAESSIRLGRLSQPAARGFVR